ncbi:MAG: hypothetical protein MI743_05840 [Sneathiellales bacterium]|nr:hypothetical protein [Sneathiellales bacterium]
MRRISMLIAMILLAGISFSKTGFAAELLMFEEEGCSWCEKWNEEIGPIYPKTAEGKRAPLRRLDIHDPIPDYIENTAIVHYTPTFVLVDKGKEIGRITGYPGEENFWWFLEQLVAKLPKE